MKILQFWILTVALCAGTPALAQWSKTIGAGVRNFSLVETGTNGQQLVREEGLLPGLEARAAYKSNLLEMFSEAEIYGNTIDYQGQNQFGQPLRSNTKERMTQVRAGLVYAINQHISVMTAIEWELWQRDIHGVQNNLGIQEKTTSTRILVGLDMHSRIASYGATTIGAIAILASPEHTQVRFSGALDDASVRTKPTIGLRLAATFVPDAYPLWQLSVGYDWMKIRRSDNVNVTFNGRIAALISQPEHVKEALTFRIRHQF